MALIIPTFNLNLALTRLSGTSIPINVFVDNQSNKSMTVKAVLKQNVIFHAEGKSQKTSEIVVRSTGDAVAANDKQNQVVQLVVPVTTPTTSSVCPILNINYKIIVTLDIPGSFDLECPLPVILTNEQMPVDWRTTGSQLLSNVQWIEHKVSYYCKYANININKIFAWLAFNASLKATILELFLVDIRYQNRISIKTSIYIFYVFLRSKTRENLW